MLTSLRKFLTIATACTLLFVPVLLGGCVRTYTYVADIVTTEDFELEITANTTEARVGDFIQVQATFRNVSGRRLIFRQLGGSPNVLRIEIVAINPVGERSGEHWFTATTPFIVVIVEKDAVLTYTKYMIVQHEGIYMFKSERGAICQNTGSRLMVSAYKQIMVM